MRKSAFWWIHGTVLAHFHHQSAAVLPSMRFECGERSRFDSSCASKKICKSCRSESEEAEGEGPFCAPASRFFTPVPQLVRSADTSADRTCQPELHHRHFHFPAFHQRTRLYKGVIILLGTINNSTNMADTERPRTPPRRAPASAASAKSPITPEQVRRMEESRLRAKALRNQQDVRLAPSRPSPTSTTLAAGQKRPHAAITRDTPASSRDARNSVPSSNNGLASAPDDGIRAARKFQKYVEYDFSKMTDTKGGFMTADDDPYNKALHAPDPDGKPANMTLREWEHKQLQRKLQNAKAGPYEPGLSALDGRNAKKCRECGSLEIDWNWDEMLHTQVCHTCKEKLPEKYSLLTKTEAKEDYLLTDPELKDASLLPHIKKPNPHKSTWNDMMLFLRYQVEEYAFSDQKWGSAEGLDAEYQRRTQETKDRKEKKFRNKLNELKKRTRVDAYKKARSGGGGEFGDTIGKGQHEHEWGRSVEDPETGMTKKACVECGMEVEELEF